jgi:NitT/TauT family transport system substrate-binding protein
MLVEFHRTIVMGGLLAASLAVATDSASAQPAAACPTMRKINIGVSVAPPNVVHTSPYVAKALGYFAKRCIDANIIQFEGGQSQTCLLYTTDAADE